ncbi:MAG: DUF11 domain-containing protein [Methanobacteriaceae archaeon]|nr:DUF11 domain-containing protein [Methanobacteriaceae archaeon]
MKKQLILLTLCFVAVFVSVSAVSAADLYVNTTGDDTTGDGSAILPFLTIAKGVTSAATGDTVIIAPGNYSGTGNKNIDISKDITIQGAGENQTIIDLEGSGYAFEFHSPSTATVKGLTIKNGSMSDYGGAIRNYGATLAVEDCTFTDNNAGYAGGAIFNSGTLTLTDCTFTGNNVGSDGGAIFNDWGATETITNCIFTGNTGAYGGVLHDESSSTFVNCIFTGNTATYGGAILNCCGSETFTGCTFTGNSATYGGAIYNSGASLAVNFSRIVGNTAPTGSAIYSYSNVNAENNWWGADVNPATIPELIGSAVDANPWLVLSISADPTEIFNSQTSKVTVDLFTDSNGANHSSDSSKYPSEIPLTFTTTWGSISQAVLNYGTGTATFTANGGALPAQNPVTVSAADSLNPTATVSTDITIKTAADLYVKVTSSNNDPKVDETFIITYKLGNNGPDAAKNVTITIPLPEGFEVSNISGDGQWTYNATTNTIIWTLENVPVGDPYLYITGKLTSAGSYVFSSSIASETFNLNTEGVTPVTVNAVTESATEVNAATKTVAMQKTGMPLAYLALAVLLMLGGLVVPKRK